MKLGAFLQMENGSRHLILKTVKITAQQVYLYFQECIVRRFWL